MEVADIRISSQETIRVVSKFSRDSNSNHSKDRESNKTINSCQEMVEMPKGEPESMPIEMDSMLLAISSSSHSNRDNLNARMCQVGKAETSVRVTRSFKEETE